LVFGAKLRRRWPSWLAIVILISVVGGFVLAAVAAGRRTESAFPRFVAEHGFDADVYAIRPLPELARLPEVVSAEELYGPDNGPPTCECTHPINPAEFGVIVASPRGRTPFKLISGHLPDPSALDQVLASFTLQQDYGVHLGTILAARTGGNGGGILASFVSGPRGQAAINHYLDAYRSITALAITPTSLINFGEAVNFPLIFGGMLAVFGEATLAHLLVVSVSRRRREVGLLKVLGFVNRQVALAVVWQATTLALIGIVIGVPLGLVAGRWVWDAFANNLGAVPVSVVPISLVCLIVAGVAVVANFIAVAPAVVATRSNPGDLLRSA
jgi:hypothetical protein